MLALLTLSILVAVHQCSGLDNISKLIRKHPTWSFEVKSVESLIEEAAISIKASFPDSSEARLRAKIRATLRPNATHIVRKVGDPKWLKELPPTFDAREKWPKCAELIGNAEDEGACYTNGPAVAASIASDRYCIFTDGAFKEKLSQEMLAACAESCTTNDEIWLSWNYLQFDGIPTGGGYKSRQGCLTYLQPPCKHDNDSYPPFYIGNSVAEALTHTDDEVKSCSEEVTFDRDCPTKCSNSAYSKSLEEDRKTFVIAYRIGHEFAIRNEILTYGPVGANIMLCSDFFDYPKGIYWKSGDAKETYYRKHLKLMGWGKENGTRYWLAVNNWDHWGPTKVFKIPRGLDYLDVEWFAVTGIFNTD